MIDVLNIDEKKIGSFESHSYGDITVSKDKINHVCISQGNDDFIWLSNDDVNALIKLLEDAKK
ncbi:hypothetical protein [Acinetobacter phage vB_ApiM_IME-Ap7]